MPLLQRFSFPCISILSLLLFGFNTALEAQDRNLIFRSITTGDGLSQSTVYVTLQDRSGYLWAGTRDGLNRIDGHTIRVFGSTGDDSGGLAHPTVRALVEDMDRGLWVGTDGGGLQRFDPVSETFETFSSFPGIVTPGPGLAILSLLLDRDGLLWIGTRHAGLIRFDVKSRRAVQFRHDPSDHSSIPDNTVWSLAMDSLGTVVAGTHNGAARLEGDGRFRTALRGRTVWSLFVRSDGSVWAGTDIGPHRCIDTQAFTWQKISVGDAIVDAVLQRSVSSLQDDEAGHLWIGTIDYGVVILGGEGQRARHEQFDADRPGSLPENNTRSLFLDRAGTMWVGGNTSGLSSWSPHRMVVRRFPSTPDERRLFGAPVTLAFAEDRFGNIWTGTERNGVHIFDRNLRHMYRLPFDSHRNDALNSLAIITLMLDDDGLLWVGTDGGGVEIWDSARRKRRHYRSKVDDSSSLSDNSVLTLMQDSRSRVWIGTYRGLNVLNAGSQKFRRLVMDASHPRALRNDRILALHEDRSGTVWVGTHGGGLHRIDTATFAVDRIDIDLRKGATTATRVNAIATDRHGTLWVATDHGLYRCESSGRSVELLTVDDGLPNGVVHGIVIDGQGNLWLSTNRGITRFKPRSRVFRTIGPEQGLDRQEFKGGASYRSREGTIYFGGIEGITAFDPEKTTPSYYVPPVRITELTVAGSRVPVGDRVVIPFGRTYFSIRFGALDFISPSSHLYTYQLVGYDEEPVGPSPDRVARFTNVPPGEYTFTVRVRDGDSEWQLPEPGLQIVVSTPYWQTALFRAALIGLVVVAAVVLFGMRLRRIRREEAMLRRIASDLHDEVSATLSSIAFFASALRRTPASRARARSTFLSKIEQSAAEARDRMGDIIWSVNPEPETWELFHARLERYIGDACESNAIDYDISWDAVLAGPMRLDQKVQLWLVLKELTINACRHSRATRFTLQLKRTPDALLVVVSDDGDGFDASALERRSGVLNVEHRIRKLGGNVRLTTAPGAGTTWTMSIPF